MRVLRAAFMLLLRSITLIGIPYALIYLINMNYPGLLGERYIFSIQLAIVFGTLAVISYLFSDLSSGFKSMFFEIMALVFGMAYTLLILGFGHAEIFYQNILITLVYPALLTLVLLGIFLRIPTAILGYLAWKQEIQQAKLGKN